MSASEVAPNPFWYAKLTAALTSRDRLSICVLAMFLRKSVIQLNMTGVGKLVKPPACFWPAGVLDLTHLSSGTSPQIQPICAGRLHAAKRSQLPAGVPA